MLRNYLSVSFRNLRKHPLHSAIHVFGLAIGLAAFLLLHHYNSFEKSYDRFHESPELLYRLTTDDVKNGQIQVRDAMSFAPSGKALQSEIPEITGVTTTFKTWRMVFRKDGQPVEETAVIAADSNFLNLFEYPVVHGDLTTMLTQPNSIVLSEQMASKYFGSANPLGRTIHILGRFDRPFEVTGVIADVPPNTHYSFNSIVSLASFKEQIENDNWRGFNYYTYVQLAENANLQKVRGMLPALSRKYIGDEARLEFNLQPVVDIHLQSDFTFEPQIHGSAKAVKFLGLISLFILFIAWVNYINLSTARAVERAGEVGLRKVVGAHKGQLITQFFTEALVINIMGAVLALLLVQFCAPYFNTLVGKPIVDNAWASPRLLRDLGAFFALGTLLTGIYPAIVLSSFKPISVLKGSFGRSRRGIMLRKTLVTMQFAVSLILISGTAIVYQQIQYMTSADLGINTRQVLGFGNAEIPGLQDDERVARFNSFAEELKRQPGIEEVGFISNLPGGGSADISSTSGGVTIVGLTERVESTVYGVYMNDQVLPTLGVELVAGRNFDRELAEDTSGIIVNMALMSLLNLQDTEAILGQRLQFGRDPENPRYTIVGVMNDYNRSSLKHNVEPTIFFHEEVAGRTMVKLAGGDPREAIRGIEATWNRFFPSAPLDYTFLDQRFAQLYLEDQRFGMIFLSFAILAIIVASMGLFGLSSYLSLQRTKEVGIRKVLGASVGNIVFLFFKDFLRLIAIAVVVGSPLVYLSMSNWLNGFAFRLSFPWWTLGVAVALVIVIAFVTVSFQTWRLALLNPAKTVKHD